MELQVLLKRKEDWLQDVHISIEAQEEQGDGHCGQI